MDPDAVAIPLSSRVRIVHCPVAPPPSTSAPASASASAPAFTVVVTVTFDSLHFIHQRRCSSNRRSAASTTALADSPNGNASQSKRFYAHPPRAPPLRPRTCNLKSEAGEILPTNRLNNGRRKHHRFETLHVAITSETLTVATNKPLSRLYTLFAQLKPPCGDMKRF
ncbi:hypothetical protein ANO11243_041500 [Dothideomycetidae sp. 11243]|nr:hypothetical protein ANO11243_041500 [fungal sp. No.11243]